MNYKLACKYHEAFKTNINIKTNQNYIKSKNEQDMKEMHSKEYVVDLKTKLMWQDNNEAITIKRNYDGALRHCKNLVLSGFNDWRLPNGTELVSLIGKNSVMNTIDLIKFKSNGSFWSSTSHEDARDAFSIWFKVASKKRRTIKKGSLFVRCVRGAELALKYPYHLYRKGINYE